MIARTVLIAALLVAVPAPAAASDTVHCGRMPMLRVPGAQYQESACLDELTTAGTVHSGHTVVADWAGLTAAGLLAGASVPAWAWPRRSPHATIF